MNNGIMGITKSSVKVHVVLCKIFVIEKNIRNNIITVIQATDIHLSAEY